MDLFSLKGFLAAASEHGGEATHHGLSFVGLAVYIILTIAIIFAFLSAARKGFSPTVFKGRAAQWSEQLYLFIENLCVGIIGPHGRRYIPFIITLWLVVFTSNFVSLFSSSAPTADLSFDLALAFISVAYVQYEGSRANGVLGHITHFSGPKLSIALLPITLMIFMIEVLSELMKNVSLSLRIFGNVDGGHRAADAVTELTKAYYIAAGSFLLPIKLLTVVVQALIFCLLTCVYISLVTSHGDDHGDIHGDDHGDGTHGDATPAPAH